MNKRTHENSGEAMGVSDSQPRSVTSLPAALFLGLVVVSGSIAWGATTIGRDIRCASYLSAGGTEALRTLAIRRGRGDPVSKTVEAELFAGAELAGCQVR